MTETEAAANPPGILPNDPNHRHNALYRQLRQGVSTAEPGRTPEHQANLAAGLTDAYAVRIAHSAPIFSSTATAPSIRPPA